MTYKLIHGDCLDILPTLKVGSIDAAIVDFPYGVGFQKKTNDYRNSKYFDNGESLKASVLYDDDPAEIEKLIKLVMPEILRIAKRALIFPGTAMLFNYPEPASVGAVYMPAGAGRTSWGFQCFQPILFYGKDPYIQRGLGARPNSFKAIQPGEKNIDHPCPKPEEWMIWAVRRASMPGETVLDCLMGSGTTGVACIQTGRNFIGVEKERKYFEIAERRISEAQPPLFVEQATKPPEEQQSALI